MAKKSCSLCEEKCARGSSYCKACLEAWRASPEHKEVDELLRQKKDEEAARTKARFQIRRRTELMPEVHDPRVPPVSEAETRAALEQLVARGLLAKKVDASGQVTYQHAPLPGVAAAEPIVEQPKEEPKQGELGPGQWAIVEVMGHKRLAGLVRETTLAGEGVLRVDVPAGGEGGESQPAATQFIHPKSLYALTPCSEEMARAVSKRYRPEPVSTYELRQLTAPKSEADEDAQVERIEEDTTGQDDDFPVSDDNPF